MKIFVVVGTRPEAIKMAPVYKAIADQPGLQPVLVSTGQHREMLDQVLIHTVQAEQVVAVIQMQVHQANQVLPIEVVVVAVVTIQIIMVVMAVQVL